MRNRMSAIVACLVCALSLTGCGGSSGSNPIGSEQQNEFGSVSTRSVGSIAQPVVRNGGDTVATAVYGGAFSEIRVKYPPITSQNADEVLAQTTVAYSLNGQPMLFDYGTGKSTSLLRDAIETSGSVPTLSTSKVAYLGWVRATLNSQIFTCNLDGTGVQKVTNLSSGCWDPVINYAGSKIAFYTYTESNYPNIYVVNTNGSGLMRLSAEGEFAYLARWSPDSTRIAFVYRNNSLGKEVIATIKPDGTDRVDIPIFTANQVNALTWSATGQFIYAAVDDGTRSIIYRLNSDGPNDSFVVDRTVFNMSASPAGNYLLCYIHNASPQLYKYSLITKEREPFISSKAREPNWGPYADSRAVVGISGLFGTSASGFLFSQQGSMVKSMLTFGAVTPASIRVESEDAPAGASTIVFVVSADNLNMLKYANDLRMPPSTVLSTKLTAAGAIVSINNATGTVASVIPYKSATPTSRTKGDELTYTGQFLGVFDKDGRNQAPNGATAVTLDPSSGRVSTIR